MLNRVIIEGFMRIAYADIDLSDATVHAFYGDIEQGKSSVKEAIRFAARGVSPRILKKGDYDLLITTGKRSGLVEITVDGVPARRNIRDGKLNTCLNWDFDEEFVDILLGGVEFARVEPETLRPMLIKLFKATADEAFVRERLIARGVSEKMLKDRVMPLIKSVGFDSAAKKAKEERLSAQGQWRGITGEAYGSIKAKEWKPELLDIPPPSDVAIADAQGELTRLQGKKDSLNTALGVAAQTLKMRGMVSETSVDDANTALDIARAHLKDCEDVLTETQGTLDGEVAAAERNLRSVEHDLLNAKQAATSLSCPSCLTALKVKVQAGIPVLVRSENTPSQEKNAVAAAVESVDEAKAKLQAAQSSRESSVAALRDARSNARDEVSRAQTTLDRAKEVSLLPNVTQEQLGAMQRELMLLTTPIQEAQKALDDLQLRRRQIQDAQTQLTRAKAAHQAALEWEVIEEACGPTSAGIPAELIGRITRPVNDAVASIAALWEQMPVMLKADMSVTRSDGMPWTLLSTSARWRANVMLQLALAQLTELKLVLIDEFDVLAPKHRGLFFSLLSDYNAANPDVSILVFGTLGNAPPPFDGVRFHSVIDGRVEGV